MDATANASGQSAAVLEAQASAVINLIAQVQTAAASQQMRTMARAMGMDDISPPGGGSGDDSGGDYSPADSGGVAIDTNSLWLEITNVANGLADLNLHFATNQVYAIWATTNLSTPFSYWQVETEVWPTDTNCMPFTMPTLNRQDLFLRAEDWTGVDSDGDGVPDWWIFYWFGNLNETATNLDSQGVNTLGYDYTNSLSPNVISFTLSATNEYVNQTTTPVQINLTGGVPSYYAVLVNDTNLSDANWQIYTGTNLIVTLGATDGVYRAWVGLTGLPANAVPTWDTSDITFTLDRVSPTVASLIWPPAMAHARSLTPPVTQPNL